MTIKEMLFAFLQTETLAAPLASANPPAIPFGFLLNQATYQAAIASADGAQFKLPWRRRYGKKFWFYYLEKKEGSQVTAKDAWRGLLPLLTDIGGDVVPAAAPVSATLSTYVYPWGIGVVADVRVRGAWSLDEAVPLAFQIRQQEKYAWTENPAPPPLLPLMDKAIATVRARAYGAGAASGQPGEPFSVVTVADAEGIDPTLPVVNGSDLHRALEAFTEWSNLYKTTKTKDLASQSIEIKQTQKPEGHVLYGGRRGRAVWFPGEFPSSSGPARKNALECYHQNLVMSTLQTESLCRLAGATATQLADGGAVGQFSMTYKNCANLAAGILGRLYGGSLHTYRSVSLRDQIKRSYLNEVNTVRQAFGLSLLT